MTPGSPGSVKHTRSDYAFVISLIRSLCSEIVSSTNKYERNEKYEAIAQKQVKKRNISFLLQNVVITMKVQAVHHYKRKEKGDPY